MKGPFAPLVHTRFRALWLAGLVSFLGTWVHNVAARWTAATL
ncbi:MAG: MFS transporter, partial [Myxococcota bacterium]